MSSYRSWANTNLRVGPYPNPVDLDYRAPLADVDLFINVSDDWQPALAKQIYLMGANTLWFPMGEMRGTMSLASIFGALLVLHNAEQRGLRVYLHCAAGINRSQTVADCYHYLREEGLSHREKHTVRVKVRGLSLNALQTNCEYSVLPPLEEMERWLLRVGEQLDSVGGGSFDYSKPPVFA